MSAKTRTTMILLGASAALALSACTAGTAAPAASAPDASAAAATPAASPTESPCGTASAADAVATGIATLRPPGGLSGTEWDAERADVSGYDPCAALAWAVVTPVDGTVSSPSAILLFHDGTYLGTATAEQYAFFPAVQRTADDAIAVTYRYARDGEPNAMASGRTQATYTWDAGSGRVVMTGDTPPTS
jgi:hypothetical protein